MKWIQTELKKDFLLHFLLCCREWQIQQSEYEFYMLFLGIKKNKVKKQQQQKNIQLFFSKSFMLVLLIRWFAFNPETFHPLMDPKYQPTQAVATLPLL